jgi:hypothetical protein
MNGRRRQTLAFLLPLTKKSAFGKCQFSICDALKNGTNFLHFSFRAAGITIFRRSHHNFLYTLAPSS